MLLAIVEKQTTGLLPDRGRGGGGVGKEPPGEILSFCSDSAARFFLSAKYRSVAVSPSSSN